MADNVTLPATGTGTADVVVATDEISGIHFQEVKLFESTLGSTTATGVTANPLQVALPAATVTTLTPPAAITGFATETTLGTVHGHVDSIDTKITACNTGAVVVTTMPTVTVNPHAVTNAGTFATQATLAAETTKVIGTVNVAAAQTIGVTSGTAANCKVEATIAASQTIAVTNTGTFAVQAALDGAGLDIIYSIDLDETVEDIKGTAGKIYGYYLFNNTAAVAYVRFYNATAANTTVGTTATMLIVPLPAGAAANCSFPQGITFSTALCFAATTGVAANDTTGPAANGVVATVFYK